MHDESPEYFGLSSATSSDRARNFRIGEAELRSSTAGRDAELAHPSIHVGLADSERVSGL
jgi:hypothetical protein